VGGVNGYEPASHLDRDREPPPSSQATPTMPPEPLASDPAILEAFLTRWRKLEGSERANYQLFVGALCDLLNLPAPEPATGQPELDGYVFERRVIFRHGDGSESAGFIDLYRRGAFVLEAKKLKPGATTQGFDAALLRARSQGENYARALPVSEGRPPFVVVVDVGRVIELYADFTRSGATYTPFPDPRSHRLRLEDLRDPAVRERLRAVWLDPLSLDPTRRAARVTFEIAQHLARLARMLEESGHHPGGGGGLSDSLPVYLFCRGHGPVAGAGVFRTAG
jgi:hypothetical protein